MGKVGDFLKKKDVEISLKRYGIDALGAMAQGLFCSLLIGTIIDINDDMVIVEFGNNRNCRIPMVKEAIVEVEKPEDAVAKVEQTSDKKGGK